MWKSMNSRCKVADSLNGSAREQSFTDCLNIKPFKLGPFDCTVIEVESVYVDNGIQSGTPKTNAEAAFRGGLAPSRRSVRGGMRTMITLLDEKSSVCRLGVQSTYGVDCTPRSGMCQTRHLSASVHRGSGYPPPFATRYSSLGVITPQPRPPSIKGEGHISRHLDPPDGRGTYHPILDSHIPA